MKNQNKKVFLATILCGLMILVWPQSSQALSFSTANQVRDTINTIRQIAGEAPLRSSFTLNSVALRRLHDMARRHYFGHLSPLGWTYQHWLSSARVTFSATGENLARGFTDQAQAVRAWLSSGPHRANILNQKFTHLGTASGQIVVNGKLSTVTVAVFGQYGQPPQVSLSSLGRIPGQGN